ncbi:MAG: hypothetical protein ACP5IX_03025 [Patescibacteria group bacterium]
MVREFKEQSKIEGEIKVPIKSGEIFDPEEELKRIKKLHGREGLEEIEKYKEKLIYQKQGLTEMQDFLIQKIRENSDISFDNLNILVQDFAVKYGFSEKQKEITNDILHKYIVRHQAVDALRKKFPEDKRLFKFLFNRKPKGKIEILTGPMTFYIRCHNLEDYAWIHSQNL